MKSNLKKIVKNLAVIAMLDMVLMPVGIFLYLTHGFHIYHVILAVGGVYGLTVVYDTAQLVIKTLDTPSQVEASGDFQDFDYDHHEDELMKPEMKEAINKVFGIK